MPTLTSLARYPVKSCRGEVLTRARVEQWGLAGDRRWMLVDAEGETVTAREHRSLLLVDPRPTSGDGLVVSSPGRADLTVAAAPPDGVTTDVTVFGRSPFAAVLAEAAAHAWFSDLLGTPVRLVRAVDPHRRSANPDFAPAGTPMAFQDGYPLNVATESSLRALNRLIASGARAGEGPLPMVRFRPNLVVADTEPWAEDGWRRLRIGAATYLAVKGCDRCAIPTTDHRTAVRFKEPTATLARHRRWDGAVWFGMQLVPQPPYADLRVGDDVEVLEAVDTVDGPPR